MKESLRCEGWITKSFTHWVSTHTHTHTHTVWSWYCGLVLLVLCVFSSRLSCLCLSLSFMFRASGSSSVPAVMFTAKWEVAHGLSSYLFVWKSRLQIIVLLHLFWQWNHNLWGVDWASYVELSCLYLLFWFLILSVLCVYMKWHPQTHTQETDLLLWCITVADILSHSSTTFQETTSQKWHLSLPRTCAPDTYMVWLCHI